MACNCRVSAKALTPSGNCVLTCDGCSFTHAVICSVGSGRCHFTGNVFRAGCSNQLDNQWVIDVLLDCGDPARKLTFHCDDAGLCAGYELTLTCIGSSIPPSG